MEVANKNKSGYKFQGRATFSLDIYVEDYMRRAISVVHMVMLEKSDLLHMEVEVFTLEKYGKHITVYIKSDKDTKGHLKSILQAAYEQVMSLTVSDVLLAELGHTETVNVNGKKLEIVSKKKRD